MNENEINLAAAVLQLMVAGKCIKAGTPVPMLGAEDYRDIVASRNTGERMKPDKIYVCGIEEGEHRDGYTDIHTAEFCLEREWKMDIEYIRADIHEKEIAKLKAALELAINGLQWRISTHPEQVNECDFEQLKEWQNVLKEAAQDE